MKRKYRIMTDYRNRKVAYFIQKSYLGIFWKDALFKGEGRYFMDTIEEARETKKLLEQTGKVVV